MGSFNFFWLWSNLYDSGIEKFAYYINAYVYINNKELEIVQYHTLYTFQIEYSLFMPFILMYYMNFAFFVCHLDPNWK